LLVVGESPLSPFLLDLPLNVHLPPSHLPAPASMSTTTKWIPLESNPQVFSDYAASLGFPTSEYAFHDIFGLDPDLLAFVPTPVKAVLLLFPTGETINRVRREEEEGGILKEGEEGGVLWIPQTVRTTSLGSLRSLSADTALVIWNRLVTHAARWVCCMLWRTHRSRSLPRLLSESSSTSARVSCPVSCYVSQVAYADQYINFLTNLAKLFLLRNEPLSSPRPISSSELTRPPRQLGRTSFGRRIMIRTCISSLSYMPKGSCFLTLSPPSFDCSSSLAVPDSLAEHRLGHTERMARPT
jgi:hypothetical protein